MNARTLQFPCELSEEVGLHANEINSFKGKGCRFYGRKTCLQWVMDYLDKITGEESSAEPSAHQRRSTSNKSCARAVKND